MTKLTGAQVAAEGLDGWVNLLGGLQTRVRTPDFATALALVDAIGAAAEKQDHHPELRLRYGLVDVRLSSHDVGGVSQRDVTLARTVTALAADAGLALDPSGLSRVELGLDTPAYGTIRPFWEAVLALPPGDADEVRDPAELVPTIWFQESGSEEPRQHWPPDVWVGPAEVQPRIDAALGAGGRLVSDAEAPAFWVLGDPEGNLVCLCTWQDRD